MELDPHIPLAAVLRLLRGSHRPPSLLRKATWALPGRRTSVRRPPAMYQRQDWPTAMACRQVWGSQPLVLSIWVH